MTDRDGVKIGITCDHCSYDYHVGIAGVELETFTYTCPSCGFESGFSDDEIKQIVAAHGKAQKDAVKLADKMLEKALKNTFK